MKKIDLLLLVAKKSLIVAGIAGVFGINSFLNFFTFESNISSKNKDTSEYAGANPKRGNLPPGTYKYAGANPKRGNLPPGA